MTYEFSMTPNEALKKIREGHQRFLSGKRTFDSEFDFEHIKSLSQRGQRPYATVLSCSDSRVPTEYIFDAGFGDLFICRNAGNIVGEMTLGAIEYAASHTGCPLLVVLGHENCGACTTTVHHYKNPDHHESPSVDDIVRRILPAVIETKPDQDEKKFINDVAFTNIHHVCRHVTQRSILLRDFVLQGLYEIVGAYYHLRTGEVEFFIEEPEEL